jgi:succinoglycan biosynthesis transport protein ExoP
MPKIELNLRDYLRIFRKRWGIIVLTVVIVPLFTLVFTLARRPNPIYEATSSVKVERSTTVAGLFIEVLSFAGGDDIATQGIIIKSFSVLEKVAKAMGFIPERATLEEINTNADYSRILSQMQSQIKTEREGNTNIVNITATSNDAKTARNMANLVAEKYREENILSKNRRIFEARKFIEEQLKTVEERLREGENTLNAFKRERGVISITDEQKASLDKFTELEKATEKVEREMKEIKYDVDFLKEGKPIPERQMAVLFADPAISKLQAGLSELILERDKLLIDLKPAHPEVKEIDKKISDVRTEIVNRLTSTLSALSKKREMFSGEMNQLKGKISLLPPTAMELGRLEREVKIDQDLLSLLKTKYQEVLIKEAEKIEDVSIIKKAVEQPEIKNPPKTFFNTVLGLIMGMILGLVFAFIFESVDTSITAIEDVEAFLGCPVVGVIPHVKTSEVISYFKEKKRDISEAKAKIYQMLISHFIPRSVAAESYRSLQTNISFVAAEKKLRSIMLTSSSPNEGKTLTAINLAITLAQNGKRVLLVDADFRSPVLHYYFGLEKEPGLSNVILNKTPWREAARSVVDIMIGFNVDDVTAVPGLDNLNILTSGLSVAQPVESLNSVRIPGLIKDVSENYDLVIFDAPPVLPVADSIVLGNKVDGVFMVYEVGKVGRVALKRAKSMLENVGTKVFGIILNNLKPESSPDFYQRAYRYYRRQENPFGESKVQTVTAKLSKLVRS